MFPNLTSIIAMALCLAFLLSVFWIELRAGIPVEEREIDVDVMLEAIRQVENWDGRSRGASGERGPWQMTRPVWQSITDKPFDWADGNLPEQHIESQRVAREWVWQIRQLLRNRELVATPFNVALVWTSGWGVFNFYHPKPVTAFKRDYAQRAVNLYLDLLKKQEAEKSALGYDEEIEGRADKELQK